MNPQHIQTTFVQSFGDAHQVSSGLLFCGKVAKTVDHVECGIKFLFDFEVSHITSNDSRREMEFLQSLVTELYSPGIQIISGHIKSGFPKFDQQSSRAAGGFKDPFHFAVSMFAEACFKKTEFRCDVRSKEKVIVFRVIVDAGGNFDRHRETQSVQMASG